MTAECTITRPSHVATFNESTGHATFPTATTIYAGPCRLQASQRLGGNTTTGGAQVVQHRYMVAIPADADPPHVNDQFTVTACAGDPSVVGRPMRVVDVLNGSLTWQRDLVVDDTEPTTR
jgi:hypothetical protein